MSKATSRLERLEETIERYQQSRLEAAQALKKIWEEELYEKPGHNTVAEYAQDRFGFRSSRTYQLIKYARVHSILDDEDGVPTPKNEAQARYLGRLLDTENQEEIPDIWSEALTAFEHGLDNLTMAEVNQVVNAYLEDEEEEEEDEPELSEVDLAIPTDTADALGLDGDDDGRGRRVVPWNGYNQNDLQDIIQQTDPETASFPGSPEEEIGTQVWTPLHGEDRAYTISPEIPERVEFNARVVQQIENAGVPGSNQSGDEDTDTLACPEVDLMDDGVPDPIVKEILERSGGTEWAPIFLSEWHGRWTNYPLPDEAWVGSTASRSSIENVADALGDADDTAVKWVLYDLGGDDRDNGLPRVDFSDLDWIVIDRLQHNNYDLTVGELLSIRESATKQDATLAVRGTFNTKLEAKPQ